MIRYILSGILQLKGLRACPICPNCGSKKFKRLKNSNKVKVRCLSCNKMILL